MLKIKKIICPSCGRITEKKEHDFNFDVIQGNTKEACLCRSDKIIDGIEFCQICR